jgi:hypothetical protein
MMAYSDPEAISTGIETVALKGDIFAGETTCAVHCVNADEANQAESCRLPGNSD